jgi:hypothetical protein
VPIDLATGLPVAAELVGDPLPPGTTDPEVDFARIAVMLSRNCVFEQQERATRYNFALLTGLSLLATIVSLIDLGMLVAGFGH